METDIFKHIKLFTKFMPVKMIKQYIFIIENNLQKVGQSFFHLSRRTTVVQDLLVRRQFSLVPDNRTNVNVEACITYQQDLHCETSITFLHNSIFLIILFHHLYETFIHDIYKDPFSALNKLS